MPWLTNEDGALKLKLQGLIVSDANASIRPVPVRYRTPEVEVADLSFPIIVIQHLGWYYAPERAHDGYTKMPYAPENFDPWWQDTGPATTTFKPDDSPYYAWYPVPYNLDYQVTLYSRIMHEHTMPLVAALNQYDRLHPKYAFLDVPQDGTKRTMQILSGGGEIQSGQDNNGKRIFWVDWRVRVFSELVPQVVTPVLARVINLDMTVYGDYQDVTEAQLIESKSLLSVSSASVNWNTSQLPNAG